MSIRTWEYSTSFAFIMNSAEVATNAGFVSGWWQKHDGPSCTGFLEQPSRRSRLPITSYYMGLIKCWTKSQCTGVSLYSLPFKITGSTLPIWCLSFVIFRMLFFEIRVKSILAIFTRAMIDCYDTDRHRQLESSFWLCINETTLLLWSSHQNKLLTLYLVQNNIICSLTSWWFLLRP